MMTTIPFFKQGNSVRAILAFLAIIVTTMTYAVPREELKSNFSPPPPCGNIVGGSIAGAQTSSCSPFDPAIITSSADATSGGYTEEYIWVFKNATTGWNFQTIVGATGTTYDPGSLTETTTFRRCARIIGCTAWDGESNDIVITINNGCCNVTSAGSISGNQSNCGSFDPTVITSVAPASGGSNNPEYLWMKKTASSGWSFAVIAGATGETYDPGTITETTVYRRCGRNVGCTSWPGETNDVTMTVFPGGLTATATSTTAYCTDTITVCDMTDYNGSRTIYMPSLGGTSGVSLFTIVNNSAKLYQFNDGTAHYVGKAEKTNDSNKQWVFSVWFKDKKDWTAWNAGGGSYKSGPGTAVNDHLGWDYYIMDAGKPNKMVGLGDYAGVELNLTHKPSSYLYAMQLGTGANDQDSDYGMSFWFEYTSSDPAYSTGHGDYNTDAPTCNNVASCGGSATASASGGVGPYAYSWSNGIYGDETKDICAGTYTVTVTDANGCTATSSTTISTTICCGNITPGTISGNQTGCGSIDPAPFTSLSPATGSGAGIEYVWIKKNASTGNAWVTIPGATSETYDAGVVTETTDFRRCARIQGCIPYNGESNDLTVTVISNVTGAGSIGNAQSSCGSFDPATITSIAPAVGVGTIEYMWMKKTTGSFIAIPGTNSETYDPGIITETTTFRRCARIVGCSTWPGESNDVVMTVNPGPSVTGASISDASCNGGNDGTISVTVSGGVSPYTYSWDNGANTASISGLSAGSYIVTVTDANGCTTNEPKVITEPTLLTSTATSTDATGAGVSDGSATVTAAGGSPAYTYLWSDGQTTATATGLAAGTYTVTVTDTHGCTTTETVTIGEPGPLTNTSTSTDVSCNSGNDGTASITVTGGVSPYTYLWDNGATTSSISGLAAGTYNVTATDANGYTTTATAVVNEPTLLSSTSTDTDVTCNGDADGTGSMNVSGGTLPYTYSWDNGATTASLTNLAPGTYVGTATDANGCTTVETITITEPTLLTSTATSTDATGAGVSDGSATVTAAGGSPAYTYLWSDGQTTATATGLAAGTYTVTVTDTHGCTTTETVTIGEPLALSNSIVTVNVLCNGNSTGSATVTVTGGVSPYTYLWSNGATTSSISGLTAGTYTVTATDANGYTTAGTATVSEPTALSNASTTLSNVSCHGANDGSIVLSVSGGVMPYTYLWSNGAVTANLSSVGPGTYSVTITDANGCIISETATLTQPNTLSIGNTVITDASCFGTATGNVTITTSGGTMPYTYLWSDGQTTATATGLAAGTYSVTVTDANSCSVTESNIVVGEPILLETETVSSTNITCFGACDGIASISVDGGTFPYTYLWSDGQTSSSASGLCPGTYSVTITDANGCQVTENNIVVTEPAALANGSSNVIDVSCNGLADGSIALNITGGTMPYTYDWSNGQTSSNASGLAAGIYSVTITDANGCTLDVNNVSVNEPNALSNTSTTVVNTTCFGSCDGSVTVSITGGTGPYTYAWSQIILNQITGDGTPTISDLCKGLYSVVVTDANGCTISIDSIEVTEPSPIFNNNTIISSVSCHGAADGSIQLDILGGTLPYTYAWSDGQTSASATGLGAGTYSVTVTDANGCMFDLTGIIVTEPLLLANASTNIVDVTCNGLSDGSISLNISGGTLPYTYAWSDGQITASATGLSAGTYSVTVTDANGCTVDVNSIVVSEPTALAIATPIVVNATCFGSCDGSISITVTGGTAPYTYDWSEIIINQIDGDGTPIISNLCKGLYSVLITDDNGCTISLDSIEITEPTPMFENNTIITNISCNGAADGAITLDIIGGTAPYSYAWDNGSTGQSLLGLSAGTYSATVTDANGCTLEITNVFVGEPLALAVGSTIVTDVSCSGSCNGEIELSMLGGTMPYSYDWSNGATTATISSLCAGTYSVTVTDANGCSFDVDSITVNEPTLLSAVFNSTDVQCYTACDGEISAIVSGGVGPYTYNWSNGQLSANIGNLCNATYTLTVTDANGCTLIDSVEITQPNELKVTASSTDVSCFGECDGTGNSVITGGVMPYSVLWSTGETTMNIDSLCPGSYTITVNDTNNCISAASIVVDEPTEIQVSFVIDYNMALITATASNGVPGYTYTWDNGTTGSVISNIGNGTYFVTATDANGCTVTDSVVYVEGGGIINQFTVNVGPNPFVSQTMMSISTTQTDQISVELFDAAGNIMEETFDGMLEANTALELVISGNRLEPGIYLARVLASDGSSMAKKLVILE
ncbi:MAG: T9SS type A sorting domain-containing protein [Crocinitomicaceae bacterium]